jgi:hypothetical protein
MKMQFVKVRKQYIKMANAIDGEVVKNRSGDNFQTDRIHLLVQANYKDTERFFAIPFKHISKQKKKWNALTYYVTGNVDNQTGTIQGLYLKKCLPVTQELTTEIVFNSDTYFKTERLIVEKEEAGIQKAFNTYLQQYVGNKDDIRFAYATNIDRLIDFLDIYINKLDKTKDKAEDQVVS